MYFEKFPTFLYPFKINGKTEYKKVKDITQNVRLRKEILANVTLFDEYDIRDAETPEHIAERVYGNPTYHWVVMLCNERYDYANDFPLSQYELETHVTNTYGAGNEDAAHHYLDVNGYLTDTSLKSATLLTSGFGYQTTPNVTIERSYLDKDTVGEYVPATASVKISDQIGFAGTITGDVLTATYVTSPFKLGQLIYDITTSGTKTVTNSGIPKGTKISAFLSGTGSTGTYQLSNSVIGTYNISEGLGITTLKSTTITSTVNSGTSGSTTLSWTALLGVPVVGMTVVGSTNIPSGTTISDVSGTGPYTLTLSNSLTGSVTNANLGAGTVTLPLGGAKIASVNSSTQITLDQVLTGSGTQNTSFIVSDRLYTGVAVAGSTVITNIQTTVATTVGAIDTTTAPSVSLYATDGLVLSLTVNGYGKGYYNIPTVTIDPPYYGTTATAGAAISVYKAVTNSDYEVEINETKRRIKLISPSLLNQILKNFNDLI